MSNRPEPNKPQKERRGCNLLTEGTTKHPYEHKHTHTIRYEHLSAYCLFVE